MQDCTATTRLRDGEAVDLPGPRFVQRKVIGKLDTTQIGQLLTDFGLIAETATTSRRARHDDAIE